MNSVLSNLLCNIYVWHQQGQHSTASKAKFPGTCDLPKIVMFNMGQEERREKGTEQSSVGKSIVHGQSCSSSPNTGITSLLCVEG